MFPFPLPEFLFYVQTLLIFDYLPAERVRMEVSNLFFTVNFPRRLNVRIFIFVKSPLHTKRDLESQKRIFRHFDYPEITTNAFVVIISYIDSSGATFEFSVQYSKQSNYLYRSVVLPASQSYDLCFSEIIFAE